MLAFAAQHACALVCFALGGLKSSKQHCATSFPSSCLFHSAMQGLTSVLLLLFGVILTAGAAQAGLPASLASGTADWAALEPAVPIMFLALVYHDLVPVIVDYLGGDRQNIRWVWLLDDVWRYAWGNLSVSLLHDVKGAVPAVCFFYSQPSRLALSL
jgi:hypothetical protein